MATMRDLDQLALAMPATVKELSEDGRPTYSVHGKYFCFHRSRRPDAVDPETGERLWLTRAQKRVAKAWLAEPDAS